MASSKLPNEILKALTEFVPPFDLIAFVTTCKTIHIFAAGRLKDHRELRDRYQAVRVINGGGGGPGIHYRHAFDVMLDIERNPWLVCYLQDAEFWPTDHGHRANPGTDWLANHFFNVDTGNNLGNLVRKPVELLEVVGLTNDEKSHWRTALDMGDHSASFAVLLTLLPNLRKLTLRACDVCKKWLDPVFRVANSGGSVKPILTRLEGVFIAPLGNIFDPEDGENPQVLEELVLIPSVRTLTAHVLGNHPYVCPATKNPDDHRVSHIQEVSITYSGMTATALAELVKPMVDLRRLDYYVGWPWDGEWHEEPNGVAQYKFDFDSQVGTLLENRGLIWKVGVLDKSKDYGIENYLTQNVKIRTPEMAHEIELIDEKDFVDVHANEEG